MTVLDIILSVFGAIGTLGLALIGWGIKRLITMTLENHTAIQLLAKDVDGLARIIGTERSRGEKNGIKKGDTHAI